MFGHAIEVSFSRYSRLRDKRQLTIAHSCTVFEGKDVDCGLVSMIMTAIFFKVKAFLS